MEKWSWNKMIDKKTKLWILIGALIVITIILIIFIKKPKEETEKLEVAVIIPLTGPGSSEGKDLLNGLLLAEEKFSPNIVLHVEDSQGKAIEGISAAKKLLDIKDIDVIVAFQSSVAIPLLTLADQYDKPLLVTGVAQDEFTKRSKNSFRLFSPARQYAAMAAEFANDMGFENVSTLTIHDEYGESIKEHFKKNFKGNIVREENFEVLERDFRTILIKISNTEAIYSVGYNIHWVSLFKQRKELGKDVMFISNQNMVSTFVQSQVGDLLTNAYATVPPSTLDNDKTKGFREEYTKKYGYEPDWVAPFGYDIVLVLDAIQKNNKNPIDAFHEIKVEGLNGLISFDEEGESNIPLVIVQAKDGELFIDN